MEFATSFICSISQEWTGIFYLPYKYFQAEMTKFPHFSIFEAFPLFMAFEVFAFLFDFPHLQNAIFRSFCEFRK